MTIQDNTNFSPQLRDKQKQGFFSVFLKIVSSLGTLIISDNVSEGQSLRDIPPFHGFFLPTAGTSVFFSSFVCCNVVNTCLGPFDARLISS